MVLNWRTDLARCFVIATLLALTAFTVGDARAQAQPQAQTKDDLAEIKAELATVKRELREIKTLLRAALRQQRGRRASPPIRATVSIKNRPSLGRPDAPVTIVEFSDYQCPYCKRFATNVFTQLKKQYVETGKVRFVLRDFPLVRIHPRAMRAATAAHCAGAVGKYWPMHDLIFANQKDLSDANFANHATKLGIDTAKFTECLNSDRFAEQIKKDLLDGKAGGVRGTPMFFVGPTGSGDTITGLALRGAQPFTRFKSAIEATLAQTSKATVKSKGGK